MQVSLQDEAGQAVLQAQRAHPGLLGGRGGGQSACLLGGRRVEPLGGGPGSAPTLLRSPRNLGFRREGRAL